MDALRIGLAIPLRGPGGIFGPSCEKVAALAVSQLNARDGILGRQVELEVIDAGGTPEQVCDATMAKVRAGRVNAVVGWHISSVREHIAPVLATHGLPYVYTSLHEGARAEGALCPGETPSQQVAPGLDWMRRHFGVRRWATVGADYIWPRLTAQAVRNYARATGLEIVSEHFVRYGCRSFSHVLNDLRSGTAEGVVMLLVGRDAVLFNRQFAAAGLDQSLVRFTPLMEENMLLASGAHATHNLYVAAAYFNSLVTESALDFAGAYSARFGPDAPALNNAAESCYEGVLALASIADAVGSTSPTALMAAVDNGVTYEGPRGLVEMRRGLSRQRVHLARAVDYEFDVLASLDQVGAAG